MNIKNIHTKEDKSNIEISKYNGNWFSFAGEFTCWVREGIVYIEEYAEGEFPLTYICKEEQLKMLYEILTGENWDTWQIYGN